MNMHAMFRSELRPDQPPELGDPRVRRTRRAIAIAAIAAVATIALFLIFGRDPAPEAAAPSAPPVTVIVPGRTAVATVISATGSLAATRDMPVGISGEGGMVTRVLVDAGDRVSAGQVLAQIDKSVQVEQAKQMAASIRAARANADLAQAQLERAQALVSRGFISRADIDQKTATRDAARAQVAVAEAQLNEMRARIDRLDIRAPEAGIVLERSVEPGQVVGQGGSPLFRIAKDGQVEMRALLAEQEISRLKVGMPAEVTPVGQDRSVAGSIWLLSPIVNPQTRQGEARIAIKPDANIRPGGFASARIMAGSADQPLLPESAVQSDSSGAFVMVVNQNDEVERRPVTLGEISERGIAIASGLSGNERVVRSAGAFLTPGEKVKPVRAASR